MIRRKRDYRGRVGHMLMCWALLFIFETGLPGTHSVAQAGLQLLPQTLKCWFCKSKLTCPAFEKEGTTSSGNVGDCEKKTFRNDKPTNKNPKNQIVTRGALFSRASRKDNPVHPWT